jgi:integrase
MRDGAPRSSGSACGQRGARHTFATLALEAGRSIRFVAEQLGHADPAITLRTYAHAMRGVERDLGHVDWSDAALRQSATATDGDADLG